MGVNVDDYTNLLEDVFHSMACRKWPIEFNRLDAAVAIMKEVALDRRTKQIHEERTTQPHEKRGEPKPATEKQLAFMDRHKIPHKPDITVDEASTLIDAKIKEWK